jgi:hypothetical protein
VRPPRYNLCLFTARQVYPVTAAGYLICLKWLETAQAS